MWDEEVLPFLGLHGEHQRAFSSCPETLGASGTLLGCGPGVPPVRCCGYHLGYHCSLCSLLSPPSYSLLFTGLQL